MYRQKCLSLTSVIFSKVPFTHHSFLLTLRKSQYIDSVYLISNQFPIHTHTKLISYDLKVRDQSTTVCILLKGCIHLWMKSTGAGTAASAIFLYGMERKGWFPAQYFYSNTQGDSNKMFSKPPDKQSCTHVEKWLSPISNKTRLHPNTKSKLKVICAAQQHKYLQRFLCPFFLWE